MMCAYTYIYMMTNIKTYLHINNNHCFFYELRLKSSRLYKIHSDSHIYCIQWQVYTQSYNKYTVHPL